MSTVTEPHEGWSADVIRQLSPNATPESDGWWPPVFINGVRRDVSLGAALAAGPPEPAVYVAEPWIRRGRHTVIGAQAGVGKTSLMIQIFIAALLKDRSLLPFDLGFDVENVERIAWIDGEMGESAVKERLAALGLWDFIENDPRVVYLDVPDLNLNDPEHYAQVAAVAAAADLVFIDSLRALSDAEENDAKEMTKVVAGITQLAHGENEPAIVTAHHQGKDPRTVSRGSSAIGAAADALFGLVRDSEDRSLLKLTLGYDGKIRYAAEPADYWFRMREGLLSHVDAPEGKPASKWDATIAELLPFTGTKTALAKACGTHLQNKSWCDSYDRTATRSDDSKRHIAKEAPDEPAI